MSTNAVTQSVFLKRLRPMRSDGPAGTFCDPCAKGGQGPMDDEERGRRTMQPMTLLRYLSYVQDPVIKQRIHHMRLMTLLLALGLLLPSLAWAVPVRTGTPIMVGIGKSNTGNITVTVPADAQMMVCTTSGFRNSIGYFSGGRLTIDGQAMTLVQGGD